MGTLENTLQIEMKLEKVSKIHLLYGVIIEDS